MIAWALPIFILFIGNSAHGYLSYSVRYNVQSCTACHISPVGGGPRTAYGKLFGAHGLPFAKELVQEYLSADARALYYLPERSSQSKGGMGIMSAAIAGHVWLDPDHKNRLVLEHNVGGFQQAAMRDTYILFSIPKWKNHTLMAGRFRTPFGIVTDEHRTFTRVQTATEYYALDTGVLLSGDQPWIHYDVALLNGEKSTGQLAQGQANRWGALLNLRSMPGPLLFGTSVNYYRHSSAPDSRTALTFYSIYSLARQTDSRIPLTVSGEYVRAWGWNSHLGQDFASDGAYVGSLDRATSEGFLVWLDWEMNPRLNWIYKWELLRPDRIFQADVYQRHGFGARWVLAAGIFLHLRTELARATHPSEVKKTGSGAQSASYAILQVEF